MVGACKSSQAKDGGKRKSNQRGTAKPRPVSSNGEGTSLERVPGVGAHISSKLLAIGVADYDGLRALWHERGGNRQAMRKFLRSKMPWVNNLALSKAVSGMAKEFAEDYA